MNNLKIVSLTKHFIHFLYNFCKNIEINHILKKYESSSFTSKNFSLLKRDKEKLCDYLGNLGFDGFLSIKYPEICIFDLKNVIKINHIVNINSLISNKEKKSKKRILDQEDIQQFDEERNQEENQKENQYDTLDLKFKKIKI